MSRQQRLPSFGIILAALCLVLTACGGAQSSGPITLTMWTWKIVQVPGWQAIAKDYQAKTGITVNVSAFTPDDTYRTKITTAAQTGDLPDIVSYWSGSQWDLASNGLLVDLTHKVDQSWQSSFLDGTYTKTSVLDQTTFATCQKDPKCTYKAAQVDHAYSVPLLAGQAFVVYANKNLLQQAGIDPNTAPKTADDWFAMMQTVVAKTHVPGLISGAKLDVLYNWLFRPMLMTSCGVNTYDAIWNGKDSFTNPCAIRVFTWFNKVAQAKLYTPDILQTDIDPADTAFTQGEAAFDLGGTYTLSSLLAQGMKPSDLLAFPAPPLAGSALDHLTLNAFSLIDGGVTSGSKHQTQALDFLKFATSEPEMETFAKIVGDLPAVKISSDPAKVGPVIPGLVAGFGGSDAPFAQSQAHIQTDTAKVVDLGLKQFITGETTPDALAAKVQAANLAAWKAAGGP